MNGFYFLTIRYKDGRVSIRDRPFTSYKQAVKAGKRIMEKKQTVKGIEINYQYGISDISGIDVKRYV